MTINEATQLGLPELEFDPVPGGTRHYVPALQNKAGELEALRRAPTDTWKWFTPLLEIVGRKKHPEPYTRNSVVGWVKRLSDSVGAHPCFLDILRLRPGHGALTRDGELPVLGLIYAAARKRGLTFVPVLPIGRADATTYTRLVRDAAATDGRGVALRYPILRGGVDPGFSHASALLNALDGVEVDVTRSDLLIDLGYLSPDEEIDICGLSERLREAVAVGSWRSFVLLGTSMPKALGGTIAEGTLGTLPRREWDIWTQLRQRFPSDRIPTYGDYLIQHPDPPQDDNGGGASMRANIRYTANGSTLIARGTGPVSRLGRAQYRDLCQQMVDRAEFAGTTFSWGDAQISGCAVGVIEPGWQDLWRGAGSSHHLRHVVEQLSR